MQHPLTGEYWRRRFVVFGMTAGPEFQTMESEECVEMRLRGWGWSEARAARQASDTPLGDVFVDVPRDGSWRWICLMDDLRQGKAATGRTPRG